MMLRRCGRKRFVSVFLKSTCILLGVAGVGSGSTLAAQPEDDDGVPWVELERVLPESSRLVRPVPIDLGAMSQNDFAVDAGTLEVGTDGVVRFTVQIVSPGGAVTVTREGIRCDTQESRRYASGRQDGSWSRLRADRWQRIRVTSINSYSSVLAREYFCPGGIGVRNAADAVSALERGGHPDARSRP